MLKIGLTGNIGSGKSTVAEIFSLLGIPLFRADDVSRSFLNRADIQQKLKGIFGSTIFSASGSVDRKILGSIVFSDPSKLALLNGLLHPLVKEHFHDWLVLHQDSPYIIHEAAILYESGFRDQFDLVIHVSCPPDVCIQRVMDRDKVTREIVLDRMKHQWSDEKKAGLSDFVILNDGSELVIPQVIAIDGKIRRSVLMQESIQ